MGVAGGGKCSGGLLKFIRAIVSLMSAIINQHPAVVSLCQLGTCLRSVSKSAVLLPLCNATSSTTKVQDQYSSHLDNSSVHSDCQQTVDEERPPLPL